MAILKNFPYFIEMDWIQTVKNADNIYRKQEKALIALDKLPTI